MDNQNKNNQKNNKQGFGIIINLWQKAHQRRLRTVNF